MSFFNRIFHKSDKKSVKAKRYHIPIALHFYSAFTLIIIFVFISTYISFNQINKTQISFECNRRIVNAIKSCKSLTEAFASSAEFSDYENNPEQFRNNLLQKIIASTDISNEADVVLFYETYSDEETASYQILWPNFSKSSRSVLESILKEREINIEKATKTMTINGKQIYYRFVDLQYDGASESYYLLFFVDSSNYKIYADYLNTKLFNTMIISIVIAGILSIIVSYPIISSTRRLSRFTKRIAKGDFTPNRTTIISRELSDLSDTMNQMAYKLSENDKEQKTFFQNASHELRTPLMSIQGYAEGIKYGIFDESHQTEAVDIIIDETNRLSDMVENLLSISKMDLSASNNYEVKKNAVNVYELLGITIEKVRGGFILNNKELINNIRINDSVHILANENDIFRMLENVFSNCLRYAKTSVVFTCYKENDYVIFEISDDGPGISDEVMSHLFDRFAKGGDGKHGIGLALVKAIAKEHNGSVEANNKPEGGALFRIKIPTISANTQLSLINKNN